MDGNGMVSCYAIWDGGRLYALPTMMSGLFRIAFFL